MRNSARQAGADEIRLASGSSCGHRSAWFDGEPQIAFGGATPAEAVDRLVGFVPGLSERTIRFSVA
jgi:hypothetical protein